MAKRWAGLALAAMLAAVAGWAAGCGAGNQRSDAGGDGDGGDGDGTGQVGEACGAATECSAVANPECIDLAMDGTTRCESTCGTNDDCSTNSDCIASANGVDGVCLVPCGRDANCQGNWVCVFDRAGVGYCLPPSGDGGGGGGDGDGDAAGDGDSTAVGTQINEPCTADNECAARFPTCFDWGDGETRCAGACLSSSDCGSVAALCVTVDPATGDALCFLECADVAECPGGWTCEEATQSGKKLCLPPPPP